jgi:hypothetical protein
MIRCQIGQYLSIDSDGLFVEPGNQLRIGSAIRTGSRIDARDPETSELPLLCLPMPIRMRKSFLNVAFRNRVDFTSTTPVALGFL